MQLPALKNTVPASLIDGMSIEDFIKNSTTNLQRIPAGGGGGGTGIAGAVYLGFDGTTGQWKLNRETVEADDVGRILVPQHGLFEGYIEWANSSPLQKVQRPLLGVQHDEPMSERLLPKPLSPGAYKKETDGPSYQLGFVGFMLDDGGTVVFEHSSMGGQEGDQRPGDDRHSGDRRLRRNRPSGDRTRLRLVREFLSHDPRPEVQRDRLRHRQARPGSHRHRRQRHHHPADGVEGQAAPRRQRSPSHLKPT